MKNRFLSRRLKCNKKSILLPLVIYWVALIVWQLIIPSELTRTSLDIAFKVGLLVFLVTSFVLLSNSINVKNLFILFLFFACLVLSFTRETLSMSIFVYYSFIAIFTFLVFVVGNDNQIKGSEYQLFLKCVVLIGFVSSLYAIVFCREQFASALRISSAYGNELMSFFDSSHVYGLYMSSAFISCLLLLRWRKKWYYYLLLPFFLLNLILTFSRTAIFSTLIFSLAYIVLGYNRRLKLIVVFIIIALFGLFIVSPDIRMFVKNIVLKNGNVAGRDTLYEVTLEIFGKMSFSQKLFGIGVSNVREMLSQTTTHENTHNAFTECLLCFGVIGLMWFVGVLLFFAVQCFKLIKKSKFYSTTFLCLLLWSIGMMFANTFIIFTSAVDCYFLTIFAIVVPKYTLNRISFSRKNEKSL